MNVSVKLTTNHNYCIKNIKKLCPPPYHIGNLQLQLGPTIQAFQIFHVRMQYFRVMPVATKVHNTAPHQAARRVNTPTWIRPQKLFYFQNCPCPTRPIPFTSPPYPIKVNLTTHHWRSAMGFRWFLIGTGTAFPMVHGSRFYLKTVTCPSSQSLALYHLRVYGTVPPVLRSSRFIRVRRPNKLTYSHR